MQWLFVDFSFGSGASGLKLFVEAVGLVKRNGSAWLGTQCSSFVSLCRHQAAWGPTEGWKQSSMTTMKSVKIACFTTSLPMPSGKGMRPTWD